MSSPNLPAETGTRRRHPVAMTVYGIAATAVIGLASFFSIQSASGGSDLRANLTLIAPAGVGGGWDTFMREQQQAMRVNGLVNNSQVVNIPGAGGTIGLGQLSTMTGQANKIMVTGAGLVAAVEQNDSPVSHADVRPIARVVEEYDVIVVPADSPYQTLEDLVAAWKADPKAVAWTGGGTFDQLVMTEFAVAAGINPSQTTYIPKSGGGEAAQALITGTAEAAASGYKDVADQIDAGRLQALGMAAPQRLEGVDIPTMSEQGYDVELSNWRALVAPPGISDEEFTELQTLLEETIATPEWQEAVERNKWTEAYLAGDEFQAFLASEEQRVAKLLEALDR